MRFFIYRVLITTYLGPVAAHCAGSDELGGRTQEGAAQEGPAQGDAAQELASEVLYASEVVSFEPGAGAGFGSNNLPEVVLGPPQGGGDFEGSLDVLSLGIGGTIVLAFEKEIVDSPGDDLVVFENPFIFRATGQVFAEPAYVALSENGKDFVEFSCNPERENDYKGCAGKTPVAEITVTETPATDSPTENFDEFLNLQGGDAFDLAELGMARARYVRIRDANLTEAPPGSTSEGFDLDAVAGRVEPENTD